MSGPCAIEARGVSGYVSPQDLWEVGRALGRLRGTVLGYCGGGDCGAHGGGASAGAALLLYDELFVCSPGEAAALLEGVGFETWPPASAVMAGAPPAPVLSWVSAAPVADPAAWMRDNLVGLAAPTIVSPEDVGTPSPPPPAVRTTKPKTLRPAWAQGRAPFQVLAPTCPAPSCPAAQCPDPRYPCPPATTMTSVAAARAMAAASAPPAPAAATKKLGRGERPSSALWLGNLECTASREDVRTFMSRFGDVRKAFVRDYWREEESTAPHRRWAAVFYADVESATVARQLLLDHYPTGMPGLCRAPPLVTYFQDKGVSGGGA